jgi:uracil-DNA glycosylase
MSLTRLLREVRACQLCVANLPLGPRPVLQLASTARLLIIGQAPGSKVHQSGIPWNDASGDRLRDWLGLDPSVFYDEAKVAILPIGFCYPGAADNPSWRSLIWMRKHPWYEQTVIPELRKAVRKAIRGRVVGRR